MNDVAGGRIAFLLSGSGSTLANLIDEMDAGRVPGEIVVVVSGLPNTWRRIDAMCGSRVAEGRAKCHSRLVKRLARLYQGFCSATRPHWAILSCRSACRASGVWSDNAVMAAVSALRR